MNAAESTEIQHSADAFTPLRPAFDFDGPDAEMDDFDPVRGDAINRIARGILRVPTLHPAGRDRVDFHDLHVERLRIALEAAYEAGRAGR